MKLSIFGKKTIEVIKEESNWIIYELSEGKRARSNDVVIPSEYAEDEVITFLGDLFHEAATPEFPDIRRIK